MTNFEFETSIEVDSSTISISDCSKNKVIQNTQEVYFDTWYYSRNGKKNSKLGLAKDFVWFFILCSLIKRRSHGRWSAATLRSMIFEEGGIFIVPCLLWHGASIYTVSVEGLFHLFTSYDKPGLLRAYWEGGIGLL